MGLEVLAATLDQAVLDARATAQIADTHGISLDEAYEVQRLTIGRCLERGEKLVGLKMGFTSVAKMEQMGVHDMIWGRLTDRMEIPAGGNMELSKFIHPRVEPEIAFRISEDLDQEVPLEELKSVCDGVAPALEVIDSRYENFKFSLEDVVADNCSSSGFVIGNWKSANVSIDALNMELIINGESKHMGSSAAILGDPWKSLQAATRLAVQYKEPIKKGHIILAGAATAAEFLQAHDSVLVNVAELGSTGFNVK